MIEKVTSELDFKKQLLPPLENSQREFYAEGMTIEKAKCWEESVVAKQSLEFNVAKCTKGGCVLRRDHVCN